MQFNLIDLWCCDKYRLKLYVNKIAHDTLLFPIYHYAPVNLTSEFFRDSFIRN